MPALPAGGAWNTKGWVGAVLEADALLAAEPRERAARAGEFVSVAVSAARRLLAG